MTTTATRAAFVPTPITVEAFDAALAAADPADLHDVAPLFDERTRTTMLTTTIDGRRYTLTLVHMPDRETRRYAREFNGYGGGERWGCAWTPAGVVDGAGNDATYCRPAELEPADVELEALPTHPCGCPDSVVTSPLRGWREQCSSCGATFDSPDPL